jgi:hypothetical protein
VLGDVIYYKNITLFTKNWPEYVHYILDFLNAYQINGLFTKLWTNTKNPNELVELICLKNIVKDYIDINTGNIQLIKLIPGDGAEIKGRKMLISLGSLVILDVDKSDIPLITGSLIVLNNDTTCTIPARKNDKYSVLTKNITWERQNYLGILFDI